MCALPLKNMSCEASLHNQQRLQRQKNENVQFIASILVFLGKKKKKKFSTKSPSWSHQVTSNIDFYQWYSTVVF